jgi:hypothetical protein
MTFSGDRPTSVLRGTFNYAAAPQKPIKQAFGNHDKE